MSGAECVQGGLPSFGQNVAEPWLHLPHWYNDPDGQPQAYCVQGIGLSLEGMGRKVGLNARKEAE
jgi:hypothetical protein